MHKIVNTLAVALIVLTNFPYVTVAAEPEPIPATVTWTGVTPSRGLWVDYDGGRPRATIELFYAVPLSGSPEVGRLWPHMVRPDQYRPEGC